MNPTPQWLIQRLSECLSSAPESLKPSLHRVRLAVANDTAPSLADVTTALIGALATSDEGISVSSLKSEVAILQHQCADLKRKNRELKAQLVRPPAHSESRAPTPRPNIRYRHPSAPPPKPTGGFEMTKADRQTHHRLNQRRSDLGLPTGAVITLDDGTTAFKLDKF